MAEAAAIEGKRELDERVYSNFDHVLDYDIARQLEAEPGTYAAHTAWNFCAYIWHERGEWYEEVWRYGSPVETRHGDSLRDLIDSVNHDYGSD